jgi:regulator of replication initiation timing
MANPITLIGGFFRWLGLFQSREVAAKTAQLQLSEQERRAEKSIFDIQIATLESERDGLKAQVVTLAAELETLNRAAHTRDLEIERLHSELELFRQQASKDRVDRRAEELLVTIGERKDGWTKPKLFSYCFGHKIAEAEYFFEQLVRGGYVEKIGVDSSGVDLWGVTEKGRPLAFRRRR